MSMCNNATISPLTLWAVFKFGSSIRGLGVCPTQYLCCSYDCGLLNRDFNKGITKLKQNFHHFNVQLLFMWIISYFVIYQLIMTLSQHITLYEVLNICSWLKMFLWLRFLPSSVSSLNTKIDYSKIISS